MHAVLLPQYEAWVHLLRAHGKRLCTGLKCPTHILLGMGGAGLGAGCKALRCNSLQLKINGEKLRAGLKCMSNILLKVIAKRLHADLSCLRRLGVVLKA